MKLFQQDVYYWRQEKSLAHLKLAPRTTKNQEANEAEVISHS